MLVDELAHNPSAAAPIAMMNAADTGSRVVYIVSLFPCWSETFIVREIHEMIKRGVDVRIVSLKHPSEKMVQSDAEVLAGRVIYPAPFLPTLLSALRALLTHPWREFVDLFRMIVSLISLPSSLAKSLVVWWRTIGVMSQVHALAPRHIHAHWATFPSTAAWLLSKRIAVPFSFTAHAHDIFVEEQLLSEKMRDAKFTVAISQFNKRYLAERVKAAKSAVVNVIHCGVSPAQFSFVTEGRASNQILAIGRLDQIKGFPHLIDACAVLRDRGVDFVCDVVGSGPLEADIRAQIERLQLTGKVNLLGAKKQEEVRALLQRVTLFVLPSVVTPTGDRDGIPVAMMEAMACGTPVVSTTVSGIPELVQDGVTGLLSEPGNAQSLAASLERILTDASLRAELAHRARALVEREFDVALEAGKLYDAIHRT